MTYVIYNSCLKNLNIKFIKQYCRAIYMIQKNNNVIRKGKIGIIGAGPGGLTSAMLLAHKGFDVTVLEKSEEVGGRSAPITLGDFKFDTGPTFLMMKHVLDEIFESCDRKSTDYLDFKLLEPMYQLNFQDFWQFLTILRHRFHKSK